MNPRGPFKKELTKNVTKWASFRGSQVLSCRQPLIPPVGRVDLEFLHKVPRPPHLTVHWDPSFWETEGAGWKACGTVIMPQRSGGQTASLHIEWKILIQGPGCPVAMNLWRNFSSDIEIKTLLSLSKRVTKYFKQYSVSIQGMLLSGASCSGSQVWSWELVSHVHSQVPETETLFGGGPAFAACLSTSRWLWKFEKQPAGVE